MSARKTWVLFAVLAAFAAGSIILGPGSNSALAAAERLDNKPYKNNEHGFAFVTFAGWTAFPPEPGEKTTIVFFRTAKTGRGIAYEATCYICLLNDQCKTLKEYMDDERSYMGVNGAQRKFLPESKLPEGTAQFEFSFTGIGCKGAGIGLEVPKGDKRYGVIYLCNDRLMKKYRRNFIYSLASFKFIETEEEPDSAGSLGEEDKNKLPIELRFESLQSSKPPGWDLRFYKKFPYYIFYSNCEPGDLNDVIRHLQYMRPQYEKYIPPLEKTLVDRAAPIVRVCKDQNDFMTYSGMGSSTGGYWSSFRGELVVFKKSQILGTMKELFFDILHHEAYHQYIYYACGECDPHIIFHEGPAEFFGAFKMRGGKMVPTLENQMRMATVKSSVNSQSYVPFKKIFYMTQGEYYANAGQCYAQGWAMTTFMLMGKQYMGSSFKKEWADIVPTYFQVFQGEVKKEIDRMQDKLDAAKGEGEEGESNSRSGARFIDPEKHEAIKKKAMDTALKDIDLEEMQKAFETFVKKHL